jgi:hypothetical protein
VRSNRYVVIPPDFARAYREVVKKNTDEYEFYKSADWCYRLKQNYALLWILKRGSWRGIVRGSSEKKIKL